MKILMYHAVGVKPRQEDDPDNLVVDPTIFEAQMRYLKTHNWRPIDPTRNFEPDVRKGFLITFDDGYESVLSNAAPILAKLDIPAVCFVVPGMFGQLSSWGHGLGMRLVDASQVREMENLGITIGNHSMLHRDLTSMDKGNLVDDLDASNRVLAALLGDPPALFAYPFGYHNKTVRGAVRHMGFKSAFATYTREVTPFSVPRVDINGTDTMRSFKLKLAPGFSFLRNECGRWPAVRRTIHHFVT